MSLSAFTSSFRIENTRLVNLTAVIGLVSLIGRAVINSSRMASAFWEVLSKTGSLFSGAMCSYNKLDFRVSVGWKNKINEKIFPIILLYLADNTIWGDSVIQEIVVNHYRNVAIDFKNVQNCAGPRMKYSKAKRDCKKTRHLTALPLRIYSNRWWAMLGDFTSFSLHDWKTTTLPLDS